MRIILILLFIILLASAGCTGVMPAETVDSSEHAAPSDTAPPEQTPASAIISSEPSPQTGGVTAISRMAVWAAPVDVGGFHDMDGLVLKYRFYDARDQPVYFDGPSVSMEVSMYTPATDRRNLQVSSRLLYRGFATITRSLPDDEYPLRGIWIPYTELTFNDQDRGIGRIHVRATLPHGVVLDAEERYIWPVRRT